MHASLLQDLVQSVVMTVAQVWEFDSRPRSLSTLHNTWVPLLCLECIKHWNLACGV